MANIAESDVQDVYAAQSPAISTSQRSTLTTHAEDLTNDVFGGRLGRVAEIEGDEDIFAAYLGAHLWEIAEGGEAGSVSQQGGSVNYQHLQTNIESTLSETRYGRVCLLMIRQNQSTAVIRSDI